MFGREKSAVAVRINHKTNKEDLRKLLFHELTHIYCAKLEMDDEHFIDIYGTGNLRESCFEDTEYANTLHLGYVIWTEFIADYYALIKIDDELPIYFFASNYICYCLGEVHNAYKEDSRGMFSTAYACLLACKDVENVLYNLRGSKCMFPDDVPYGKETNVMILNCFEHLYRQLKKEKPWKINEEFIHDLGEMFLSFKMWNSFRLGKGSDSTNCV